MSDLQTKRKQLTKAKKAATENCVNTPNGTYLSQNERLACVERKGRTLTTVKRLEKEIKKLLTVSAPPLSKTESSRTSSTKSLRGRPPMDCSKLDNKISERKTEKGKNTMLRKCSDRSSHPKKPCVVKNNKCVSK